MDNNPLILPAALNEVVRCVVGDRDILRKQIHHVINTALLQKRHNLSFAVFGGAVQPDGKRQRDGYDHCHDRQQ